MKREDRYIVLKKKDLASALKVGRLAQSDIDTLNDIQERIRTHRFVHGKNEFNCLVVESDWPEYEHVWELIRLRVEKATIPAETVQGVVDAPAVDAALRSFTEDATNDNAFFLVRAVMEACLPRAAESDGDQS